MKSVYILLLLTALTHIFFENSIICFGNPIIMVRAMAKRSLCTLQRTAHSFYNKVWGTSPDISLSPEEVKRDRDTWIQEAQYPRNVTYHLMRVGQLRKNTQLRSKTVAILAGIMGSSIARYITNGFHGDLSAFRIVASGITAGTFAWFLANRFVNRTKQAILENRTQHLLKETPEELLYDCYVKHHTQSIRYVAPIDMLMNRAIMETIDGDTFDQMYRYWYNQSKPPEELIVKHEQAAEAYLASRAMLQRESSEQGGMSAIAEIP